MTAKVSYMNTSTISAIFWLNMTLRCLWVTDFVRALSTMPTMKRSSPSWTLWASWCSAPGTRMCKPLSKVPDTCPCIRSRKIWNAKSKNAMMRRSIRSAHWSRTSLRDMTISPPLSVQRKSAGSERLCCAMLLQRNISPCRTRKTYV